MKAAYSLPSEFNEFSLEPTLAIEPIENPPENKEDDSEVAPRRSKRPRTAKSFGEDFTVYLVDDTPQPLQRHMHHLMLNIRRMQSVVRWTPSLQMVHGK